MKILVATGIFPPQIGGPATYSKLIYDELPKRGIEVEIASFGDYIHKPRFVRHFMYFMELLRKAPEADIIYAMDPVSVGLPALFASQIRGKELVLKVVGDYAWEQGTQRFGVTDTLDHFARNHGAHAWQVRLLKWIEAYVAEGAKRVITPSKYLKSILVDWGVDSRNVSVIYNGFHIEPVKETPSVLKKRMKWTGKTIVTVGRLVPWKGIKEVIEAMPDVIAAHPDAKLLVIGDGPDGESLKKRATELAVADRVAFTGRLDQRTMFEYVKASDLFVLNTAYEGFSHQILETMALGTPVITTAVGGNVEIIRNAENGILIAPGALQSLKEAIIGLLGNIKGADGLARKAKKDVSGFTDEIMLDRLADELKKI
ncbi:MAG TPA: glycosyltransferase family 4 protein [Candidatus Paceibacterota bacterium]|nr:glycosyltransferase family 4 protein [Candidatus Paceibacterota bacterium]